MGSIIGSIYPIENIVIQEPSVNYKNFSDPAYKAVMDKYGIDTTTDLSTMKSSKLRLRKRKVNDALKVAASEEDKKWLNWELDKIQNRLKEISSSTWGDIWGGLVDISGAKPESGGESDDKSGSGDKSGDKGDKGGDDNSKGKKTWIYVGIGVGALALVGTIVYLATRKK